LPASSTLASKVVSASVRSTLATSMDGDPSTSSAGQVAGALFTTHGHGDPVVACVVQVASATRVRRVGLTAPS